MACTTSYGSPDEFDSHRTVWISKTDRIATAIRIPVVSILDRVPVNEPSEAGIIIPIPEQFQTRIRIFLISKCTGVAERSGPGASRSGRRSKRLRGPGRNIQSLPETIKVLDLPKQESQMRRLCFSPFGAEAGSRGQYRRSGT